MQTAKPPALTSAIPDHGFHLSHVYQPYADAVEKLEQLEHQERSLAAQIREHQAALAGSSAQATVQEAAARLLRGDPVDETPLPAFNIEQARFQLRALAVAKEKQRVEVERQLSIGSRLVCEALAPAQAAIAREVLLAAQRFIELASQVSAIPSRINGAGCRVVHPLSHTSGAAVVAAVNLFTVDLMDAALETDRPAMPEPAATPEKPGLVARVRGRVGKAVSALAAADMGALADDQD